MKHLSSDPFDILLASDAWGTRNLLIACRKLTEAQFHQKFEIGLGSLHENLTHIVGTMRRWCDRIDGRPLRASLIAVPGRPDIPAEVKRRTPDELLALLADAERDLRETATKWRTTPGGLDGFVHLEWPRKEGGMNKYTFTRGCCFTHVCTHGFHHRAQCLNMLRHLGLAGDDQPESSTIDWQVDAESPAVKA